MSTSAARRLRDRRLSISHPAHPAWLRLLRRQVGEWAARHRVPEQAVIDLQLVLGEAVSNGVEHAYPSGAAGTIDVELELRRDGDQPVVAVLVIDHGRWRPIPTAKGGRGRGLMIIGQLSRRLRIRTSRRGTRLSCLVPVPG